MEKMLMEGLDLTLYQEILDNGFTIYMVPLLNKKNYTMTYATWYGSDIIEFSKDGKKMKKYPTGIAHFLEHKMFEQENGEDPFVFFGKTGTDANAATDHEYTKYICTGTKNFKENFRFLLEYVNAPYFTDENVEKEKGIIEEELNMYLDIPEFVIENKIKENTYQKHPRRIDVGGTVDDIKKITKEDLYDCYHTFYQPNNMFALLVGNFEVEEAIQIAREVMAKKENKTKKKPSLLQYKEPLAPTKKEETITMNIKVPKVLYASKFEKKDFPIKDKHLLSMYLQLITSIIFGPTSIFREEMRRRGLMLGMYYEWEDIDDIFTVTFYIDTKKPVEILKELKKTLSNIEISKEEVERYKKVWIANEVRMTDYVDATNNNLFSDIIHYGKPITNRIPEIRSINKKELDKVLAHLKMENTTELTVLPKEEK